MTEQELDTLQSKAKSQLNQDMFVLSELGFKKNGYFVEFGATDGKDLSNTHLLEKEMGWTGILAEPAWIWASGLALNRKCNITFDCVWSKTGEILEFNEPYAAELATINSFSNGDEHAKNREGGHIYEVKTISLLDLLKKYNAPKEIDYLSIDTEGSEFEILNAFDFDAYQFRVITCEHNYTPMREKIYDLLTSKGYTRKHKEYSRFDDWYVLDGEKNELKR